MCGLFLFFYLIGFSINIYLIKNNIYSGSLLHCKGKSGRRGWHCPPLGIWTSPASRAPLYPLIFQQALTSREMDQSYKCFRPSLELPQPPQLVQNSGATWGKNPCLFLFLGSFIQVRKRIWGQRVASLLAGGREGRDSDGGQGREEGWR